MIDVRKIAVVGSATTMLTGMGHGHPLPVGEYKTVEIDGTLPGVQWLIVQPFGLVCVSASDPAISYRTEEG